MSINNSGSILYEKNGMLTTVLIFKINETSTIGTSLSNDVRISVLDKEDNDTPVCVKFKVLDNGLVQFSTNNVKNCKIDDVPFTGHKYLLPGNILTILDRQFFYQNPNLPHEIIEMTQNTNKELERIATQKSINSNNRRHTILPMKSALKNFNTPNKSRTPKRQRKESSCSSSSEDLEQSMSASEIDGNSHDDFDDPPDLNAFDTPPALTVGAITRRRSTLGMNAHLSGSIDTSLRKTQNSSSKLIKIDRKNSTPEMTKQTLRSRAKSTDINMHFSKQKPATIRLTRNSISSIPTSIKVMKLKNSPTSKTPHNDKTIRDDNSLFKRRSSLRKSILKKTPLLQDKISIQNNATKNLQYKPSVNEGSTPSAKNISLVTTRRSTREASCVSVDIEENDIDSLSNEDIYADNSEKNSSDYDSDHQNDDSLSKTTSSQEFSPSNSPNALQLPNQPSRKNSKKLSIFKNSSMSSIPDRESLDESSVDLELPDPDSRNSFVETRSQRRKSISYLESLQSRSKSPNGKHLTRHSTIEKSACQLNRKSRTLKRTRSESPSTLEQRTKRPKVSHVISVRKSANHSHELTDGIRELLDTTNTASQYEFSDMDGIKELMDSSSDSNWSNRQKSMNGTKGLSKNTKRQMSPKNDLTDVRGVRNIMKPPRKIKSPNNDLREIKGIKKLMATRKQQNSPNNDLSNIIGVKKLLATPKVQKTPKNDLENIVGVKTMFKTPRIQKSPKNDLRYVAGVKKTFTTPRIQRSPENDLTNIKSFKKIFATPKNKKSPKNDLTTITGVKEMFKSPKHQKSPRNDLRNVAGIRKLLATPKFQTSPKNDLTNIIGVKKLMKTPKTQKAPESDYTNVGGVKKLFAKSKLQKPPKNSLSDLRGVKQLLCPTQKQSKSPLNDLSDVTGVKELFNFLENSNGVNYEQVKEMLQNSRGDNKTEKNHNSFDVLTKKKTLRTYKRKSVSQNDKHAENETETEPEVSETVIQWVEDQGKYLPQQKGAPVSESAAVTPIRKSKRSKRSKNLDIVDTISTTTPKSTRNSKKKNADIEKNKNDANKENVKGNGSIVESFEQNTEDIEKSGKPRRRVAKVLTAEQNFIQDDAVEIFEKNTEDNVNNGKSRRRRAKVVTTEQNVIQDEPAETKKNTENSVNNVKLRRRGARVLTTEENDTQDESTETVESNTKNDVNSGKPRRRGARAKEIAEQNIIQGDRTSDVQETKSKQSRNKAALTEEPINENEASVRRSKRQVAKNKHVEKKNSTGIENDLKDSTPIMQRLRRGKLLKNEEKTDIEVVAIKNNNSNTTQITPNNKELRLLKNTNTELTPTFDNPDLFKTHEADIEDTNPSTKKRRGRKPKNKENNQLDLNKIQEAVVKIKRSKALENHINTDMSLEEESGGIPTAKTRHKKIHSSNEIQNQTKKRNAKVNIESKVNIDEEPPIRQSKRIKNKQNNR